MTLIKPTLFTTPSFDANDSKVFTFSVQDGGSQVVANQLIIREQKTNSIIYQAIQNTFKYEHVLPKNTLTNGEYYNATIITLDNQGNKSLPSSSIQFYCYTTPTINFLNIPDNYIINNISFEFRFKYEQQEGELLNSYVINLYNESLVLISTSKVIYVKDGTPPYENSYVFSGFEDNTAYYIEIIGETINGAVVSTDRVKFSVTYNKPSLFTLLELKNNCEKGFISITSNIILINGESNPQPPIFIDGKEIDLRKDESYVKWTQGYKINGDFLVRSWFRMPNPWTNLIQFSNTSGQTIRINYMEGYENNSAVSQKSYIEVYVTSVNGMDYYIYSNYIDILSDTEYYNLQLQRIDGIYEIKLLKM